MTVHVAVDGVVVDGDVDVEGPPAPAVPVVRVPPEIGGI